MSTGIKMAIRVGNRPVIQNFDSQLNTMPHAHPM
jgi:hypothetical protein